MIFEMRLSTLLALVALAVLYLWSQSVLRQPKSTVDLSGKAQAVDGDSLRLNGQMIRLKGIDAPEYAQICVRDRAEYRCGHEAFVALRKLLQTGDVRCDGAKHDRYGRVLGLCSVGAISINSRMVREGYAVSFGDYLVEEAQARNEKKGLWAGDFEMPRDYRARHPRDVAGGEDHKIEGEPAPTRTPLPPTRPKAQ